MARQKFGIKLIWILMGLSLFLAMSSSALVRGNHQAKVLICAAALLFLFISLIYFQLKFYREGDRKNIRNHREFPSMDLPAAPRYLRSPYHRIVWQNIEQSRRLMLQKEKELLQAQTIKEKQTLRLPHEETILFMADRSRICFWPAAFLSLILLIIASTSPQQSPAALSFACLMFGLFGLLLLTATRFQTRYYITNFRILIRKKWPMGKTRWSAMNYVGISTIYREKKFAREALTIKSGHETINIQGLSGQKLQTVLDILRQKLPPSQSSPLEFYP